MKFTYSLWKKLLGHYHTSFPLSNVSSQNPLTIFFQKAKLGGKDSKAPNLCTIYNWRAGCKNLVSENFGRFSVLLKTSPNFASWLEMNLRTLPWYFFYWCELYFWEISYAKTLSASRLRNLKKTSRMYVFYVKKLMYTVVSLCTYVFFLFKENWYTVLEN